MNEPSWRSKYMIRVDLPDRTIGFSFKHPTVHRALEHGDGKGCIVETVERRCSVAEIFEIDGVGNATLISKGIVHCWFRDNFDKEIGRKKALAAALHKCMQSKAERRRVWDAYFNRGQKTTIQTIEEAIEKAMELPVAEAN